MWPEEENMTDVARREECDLCGQKTVKMADMANIGEYNGYGQKRVVQRMWPEEGNLKDMARGG